MTSLHDKLQDAARIMDAVLSNYFRPAVMWSAGKDSMVLLHLLRASKLFCPVIFHREPFFAEKYEFAERIRREWNLTVYDWPPAAVTLQKRNGVLEPVSHYQAGRKFIRLPKNVYPPTSNEPFLCGLRDVVHRPTGAMNYPWDVVFHGHRSADVDPLLGAVPLHCDIKQNEGGPALAFPLRQWTDSDIWEYTRQANVPQQADRYNVETGEENPDKRTNPDHWCACMACLDRDGPAEVWCPKLKTQITSVGRDVPYTEPVEGDYFGGRE